MVHVTKMIHLNHFLAVKRLPVNNLTVLSIVTFAREAKPSNWEVDMPIFAFFSVEKCSSINALAFANVIILVLTSGLRT